MSWLFAERAVARCERQLGRSVGDTCGNGRQTSCTRNLGRVDYEDSSGSGYWTKVCRYYETAFQLLVSCPNGNAVGKKDSCSGFLAAIPFATGRATWQY
jgi:hypothetical protein